MALDRDGHNWTSGAAYEPYIGRWSRLVAVEFLEWLAAPASGRWLDVGCGTGAVTQTVLDRAAPSDVVGIDPSEGFIAYAREHVADPRARFEVGTATDLPLPDGERDVAVSGLVLNFVPDAALAAAEMARVTRPGGLVAAYVWDYAGGMQLLRRFWDAAGELDPRGRELDEGRRFPLCYPGPLTELFDGAGLRQVQVIAIDVPTRFAHFDDLWTPFLSGHAPAPTYAMSLTEDDRAALRENLRARLPYAQDGSIALTARAHAVRGIKE
jgi:SAM-dependent methyltransferase